MSKLGLIAVMSSITLLAACGSTKTVTVTSGGPTSSPSANLPATGQVAKVISCFQTAGAAVRGPKPAGQGKAVYATTRDGGQVGYVKAPSAALENRIALVYAQAGNHVKPIQNDPTAFTFYTGVLTNLDSQLLSKCTK